MGLSSGKCTRAFETGEWDDYIVQKETDRVWFGHAHQKDAAIWCLLLAFPFVFFTAGIFLEGEGLRSNLKDVTTCVLGIVSLIVTLLFTLAGVGLLKSRDRIGVMDLKNQCFSTVNQRDGRTDNTFSCEDLYVQLEELTPIDGDTDFYARITIMGPEKPAEAKAGLKVNATIFNGLGLEEICKAAFELHKAASWKGIIGSGMLINLYRSGCYTGS